MISGIPIGLLVPEAARSILTKLPTLTENCTPFSFSVASSVAPGNPLGFSTTTFFVATV